MTSLLLPESVLVHTLNVALASFVCCGVAMVVGKVGNLSLQFRHAVLVVSLVTCLLSPFLVTIAAVYSTGVFPRGQLRAHQSTSRAEATIEAPAAAHANEKEFLAVFSESPSPATLGDETHSNASPVVEPQSSKSNNPPVVAANRVTSFPNGIVQVLGNLLVAIWLTGALVGLRTWVLRYRILRQLMMSHSNKRCESVQHILELVAHRMGLKRVPDVLYSSVLPAPFVAGLRRPALVLPSDAESSLTSKQLHSTLTHELAHIARHDLWIGALQRSTQMLYWWNPLVHVISRKLSELRELICDDIATDNSLVSEDYAAALVKIAERVSNCSSMPAILGISHSPIGELERRVRRILSPKKSTRRVRLGFSAGAGVAALTGVMVVGMVLAQVADPLDVSGDDEAASPSEERPSMDELVAAFAKHEQRYLPYHIKVRETFRMADNLAPREKRRFPWADGRLHQDMMEYAQREAHVWLRKETSLADEKVTNYFHQFNQPDRQMKVSEQDGLQVHVDYGTRSTWVFNTAYAGLFPLFVHSNGMLLSKAISENAVKAKLDWDNSNARLEFQFGWKEAPERYRLWLSRNHDWHPIKLQRFNHEAKHFLSEWEAARLKREAGDWMVKEGTIRWRHYEDTGRLGAKVMYSRDFVVLNAEFGEAVSEDRFIYEIPAEANVHDPKTPKQKPAIETRELNITVTDLNGDPIQGAKVGFGTTDGDHLDTVKTGANGVARTEQAPADHASIEVSASEYRPASWIVGSAADSHQVRLAPKTHGMARNEDLGPLADVWVKSDDGFGFGENGLPQIPRHAFAQRENDWTDNEGQFVLETEVTLRRTDKELLLAAVNDDASQMSFDFVPIGYLGEPQELILRPTSVVRGVCVFESANENATIWARVLDEHGRQISSVLPEKHAEADGLRAEFQLRLPAGNYMLTSQGSSDYSPFSIPILIKEGLRELNFGAVTVAAQGLPALVGKSAPNLHVSWRTGEESSLADLRGNVVVLDFWGNWCIPCVKDMPGLMDMADRFKDRPVRWLTIHTPNVTSFAELDEKLAEFKSKVWQGRNLSLPTALDLPREPGDRVGQTATGFGVGAWPTIVLIDKSGAIVGRAHKGALAESIESLLSGN